MSNFDRSIVSIIEPKIKVDRISQEESESVAAKDNTNQAVVPSINTKNTSRWGAYIPLIMINSHKFEQDQIQSMSLDVSGKIPSLSVSLIDPSGKFSLDTPLDGDVISLYIRPPDEDNQKPIRIDFDILSISSDPSTKNFGLSGIMKIPGFFAEKCKGFPSNTSFEHLLQVCEDVGLGFASNESSTDDTMIRMVPFETYETFVNHTVEHTYKDDDSFFTWYVDPFYYMCLVNINKQFSLEDKNEEINISTIAPMSGLPLEEKTKDSIKGNLILTNQTEKAGTNIYIENWSMANNSASVWINNGYKKYTQYLDIDDQNKIEYVSNFADPLTTPGVENDQILMKGRANDDFYKDQNKYKWIGKQAVGNVHDNYIFSKILNFQNIQEIGKVSLNVELAGMNFYIYKYMRIPIAIYESGSMGGTLLKKIVNRDKALGEDGDYGKPSDPEDLNPTRRGSNSNAGPTIETIGDDVRDQVKNDHISGFYLVNSIKYTYTPPGPIKMKLNLIRREWPIPAKNKDY
jgi:hypothetical protein